MQFDHGQPWRSGSSDLSSLFELWLVGLGIEVVWSRPRRPQDNGIVERSHRVTQSWSAPQDCHTLEQLQQHLNASAHVQRQLYPNREGLTRWARYPQLGQPLRPYQAAQEDQVWSLERVHTYLAQKCWQRKVDASSRISLYNHNYTLQRQLKGQRLWIRFDPTSSSWTCWDDKGQHVAACPSLEIQPEVICQLQLHRSMAKHVTASTSTSATTKAGGAPATTRAKADVAPLS